MCYGYKLRPNDVLSMEYPHFIHLAQNLEAYREEESATTLRLLFGDGKKEQTTERPPETQAELHALFGGLGV